MVFSSSLFLLYFLPAFLVLYYLLPGKARNLLILLASIFFYAWGAPDFIFIVLGAIAADYYIVEWMSRSEGGTRKWLVSASMVLNVGLLAYFKYANFFIANLNDLFAWMGNPAIQWTRVALPIGISFFTFQKITYAIDVYRRKHAPLKRVTDYAMYILMFPQLIAGPIVRFNEIADQIEERRKLESIDNRLTGFFRFIIGLSKKVLVANIMGEQADQIFAMNADGMTTGTAWLGVIAYAFQIYFDFSGYSDMAIGLGRMIGFKYPENFDNPYISGSITEFWRRWHMTLGRFMRDYLYIPLGGNRVSTARLYFNLWVVFAISGLWHGAAWNFVLWGIYHGLFLILDRLFLLRFYSRIGRIPSVMITLLITLVGWVLFRSETINYAWIFLGKMFTFTGGGLLIEVGSKFWSVLAIAAVFSLSGLFGGVLAWQQRILSPVQSSRTIFLMVLFSVIFFIINLSAITSTGFNPFIYFRF